MDGGSKEQRIRIPKMFKCEGCGLDQPPETTRCGFCGHGVPGENHLTKWSLSRGEDDLLHEQDLRDHWNLKRLWSRQLATPAVGVQAGLEHGGFLEQLEQDVRLMEEELEIQKMK